MTDFQSIDERLYGELAVGKTAFLPLPDRAVWKVTGEDRVRYLNGQVTNDVSKLSVGTSQYAAVLTGKGKIVGDLFLAALPDALLLDAPLELRETLRERFEKFLIADDVIFEDLTGTGFLTHCFGAALPDVDADAGDVASANRRFGLPGFDLWRSGAESAVLRDGPVIGAAEAEAFRIEHAIAAWGREIDGNSLPQEVLLDVNRRGLSYEKGCYVGQETVARIRSIGHVNRKIVFLEQTAGPSALGAAPFPLQAADGAEAGRITSIAFSPHAGGEVALAMVGRNYFGIGIELVAGERRYRVAPPSRQ